MKASSGFDQQRSDLERPQRRAITLLSLISKRLAGALFHQVDDAHRLDRDAEGDGRLGADIGVLEDAQHHGVGLFGLLDRFERDVGLVDAGEAEAVERRWPTLVAGSSAPMTATGLLKRSAARCTSARSATPSCTNRA